MIPCEECLTISLCKARLYASGYGHTDSTYGVTGMLEEERCPILEKYIYPEGGGTILPRQERRINKTRKLFGLDALP